MSATTRERILAGLKEMGYRRGRVAGPQARQRAVTGKQMEIVLDAVCESAEEQRAFGFYSQVMLAAARRLEAAGHRVAMTDIRQDRDRFLAAAINADAIIHCSPLPAADAEWMRMHVPELPSVMVCHQVAGISSVHPDEEAGGRLAAEHLVRLGHRHVALFTVAGDAHFGERSGSFLRHLARLAPDARIHRVAYPLGPDGLHADPAEVQAALSAWWAKDDRPTAMFAVCGYATLEAYRFLRRQQVAMPQRVGLLGYDDLPFYDHLDTPISRVVFAPSELGLLAADTLLAETAPEAPRQAGVRILTPTRLIDRGSVLPIAG